MLVPIPWALIAIICSTVQIVGGHRVQRRHGTATHEGVDSNFSGASIDTNLKERLPYIIVLKEPGSWYGAELSWDGRSDIHPAVSVDFADPVPWQVVPQGNGLYRILQKHPGSWYNAELSWDSKETVHRRRSPGPRVTVDFDDPVQWAIRRHETGNYRILSKHPGDWYNAMLIYEKGPYHPMATINFVPSNVWNTVLWEFKPVYTVSFEWIPKATILGNLSITYEEGQSRTNEWSKTEDFTWDIEATLDFGPPADMGVGGSLSAGATKTTSKTVGQASEKWTVETLSVTVEETPLTMYLWQSVAVARSNYHIHRNDRTTVLLTRDLAATPGKHSPPRCAPGYCKFNTGCQECSEGGDVIFRTS